MAANDISHERLRELLEYNPEAGMFTWRVTLSNRAKAGTTAGTVKSDGYRVIRIDGRGYAAHCLAHFYMTGEWPAEEIDHINAGRDDNRWANLREATRAENQRNYPRPRTNTSGVKGVSWSSGAGKWVAHIRINGRSTNLGYFTDIAAASAAYADASSRHHGKFGRIV